MVKGPLDGFFQTHWLNTEDCQRRLIEDQRRVSHALDKLAANACVDRSNQAQPQTRQVRRQDGHRNHPSPQSALPRILLHDFTIADLVGTTDLKNCGLFKR